MTSDGRTLKQLSKRLRDGLHRLLCRDDPSCGPCSFDKARASVTETPK